MDKYELKIGDKIQLSGGYDFDPLYLKNPPADKRTGTILKFIEGQNDTLAAVAKLDSLMKGEKIIGDFVVLELRYEGANWCDEFFTVHIELCDFEPENKTWKKRKQGEWVEAASTLKII